MSLKLRVQEAGAALTTFVIYQALALAGNVLLAGLFAFLTLVASAAAAHEPEAGFAAIDSLAGAVTAGLNAGALLYGLRLLYVRHPLTRRFWTVYLVLSLLLYGYHLLRGDSACFSAFPLVANLGWLVFWLYSRRVGELCP